MGQPKATLLFGGGTLLDWMVGLVGRAVGEVWVSVPPRGSGSREEGFPVPERASGVIHDATSFPGPLAALGAALRRFGRPVLLVGCDFPFIGEEDLRALASAPPDVEALLLADDRGPQPLAALYRPALLVRIERLLAEERRAMRDLLGEIPLRTMTARAVHPGCPPLANLNTPEDLAEALARARACGLIPARP
jgi:molybdopterin-guanine dinucleotide biosynthesis protein A